MTLDSFLFGSFLAAIMLAPYRIGSMGTKVIDMKKKGELEFKDPFVKNFGAFHYYSYTRHDTSELCSRVASHLILQTQRGISARPVEFKFQ